MSPPRPDPIKVRHAVLLASAVGLKKAAKVTGVSMGRLSQWRTALEADTGETFPRRHDLKGKRRPFPLTPEQCAEMLALRPRGFSYVQLGARYGVSKDTARKACAGV